MDKAGRAQLLRERFKAKAGKWQFVPSGERRQKNEKLAVSRLEMQSFGL